jgi:hypothetical protein
MTEDFVSFDLAKKLTLKGFNAPCIAYYDEGFLRYNTKYPFALTAEELLISHNKEYTWVDAPTIPQVLKWLREEKKIYLELIVVDAEYMCNIYKIEPRPVEWVGSTGFSEIYEAAALEGIEYVIDNLI